MDLFRMLAFSAESFHDKESVHALGSVVHSLEFESASIGAPNIPRVSYDACHNMGAKFHLG